MILRSPSNVAKARAKLVRRKNCSRSTRDDHEFVPSLSLNQMVESGKLEPYGSVFALAMLELRRTCLTPTVLHGRAMRSSQGRGMVPWPALNKIRNHLGTRLFSIVQNIEYQRAYQTPVGAIRVRIRLGAATGTVSNFCANETRGSAI